ncbi:hypothetical protein [Nocardioides donggukensis]|uniref:DUF4383 domain-containing protein n=1 Tax=Nocardioides donggukensis TaxID=2774019 RepID=A0A927K1Z1_9ACTN|nr:hypothetical protein [Nocardioides donggukensis]MBD8868429.1 hypothetical protein [Nocardioides donggukensis]
MSAGQAAPVRSRVGREVFVWGLAGWGLLHLVGGASLLAAGGTEGLDTLAPGAATPAPDPAGEAAAAVVHFHGFNIAAAGLLVLALALAWRRTGRSWQAAVAVGVAAVLDLGLVAFLLAPGLMPLSEGLWGIALLAVGLVGYAVHRGVRRPVPVTFTRAA